MFVASVLFMFAVWLLVHLFNKNLKTSIIVATGLVSWYAVVFILGLIGFFGQTIIFIPFIAFGFVVVFTLLRFLYNHPYILKVFEVIPLHWLIGVQIFRLMGYGFLSFYFLGLLPAAFAIPTGVGDVIIGLTAPVVAFLLIKGRAKNLALIWNYLGIGDLALALTLGVLTYPRPIQLLPSNPSNELIALFPLVMVPLFAVPLSILLHLFTLKRLKTT